MIDEDENGAMTGSALFSQKPSADTSLLRGAILHRFLQVLPSIAPGERQAAAERYLLRSVPRWPIAQRQALTESVLKVIEHPELSTLFSEGSRAEVSVMGTLKLGTKDFAVSGRIDRLAVSENTVLIADFKTNREIPSSAEAVPFVYRAQLAIYRALLQPLYPDHIIQCVLIYTGGPTVLTLPAACWTQAL